MSWWDTEEFKKLKKEWYGKLAEAGFKDAELNPPLDMDTAHTLDMAAVQEHYMQVAQYLHYGEFEAPIEKAVWFVYSEGYSVRNVSRILHMPRKSVTQIVEKHTERMKHGKAE
jgi:hypothetical protein